MSLVQESINVLRKCAVQVNVPVDGYPENIQFFRYYTLSLVQSTFNIQMDATVGWLKYSVDYSKFEAKY